MAWHIIGDVYRHDTHPEFELHVRNEDTPRERVFVLRNTATDREVPLPATDLYHAMDFAGTITDPVLITE